MRPLALECAMPSLPGGLRLAVLLSLALHALLALALWVLPVGGSHVLNDQPLADVPVVVVPAEEFTVSLASESSAHPVQSASGHAESEPSPLLVSVQPLPLDSHSSTAEDLEAPHVTGHFGPIGNFVHDTDPDANKRSGAGSGTGLLAQRGNDSADGNPTFFGVGVPARSVVFVIDRSISMGLNGGLDAAKRELHGGLEGLPATTRFQVLLYNRTIEALPSPDRDRLLANTETTRREVLRLVDRTPAQGGTDHVTAIRQAISLRPEAILIVTDADDLKPDQVRDLTRLNGGRTVIHALQWSQGLGANEQLKALAHLNRGIYRKIPAD